MRAKKSKATAVVEALQKSWRESELRKVSREQSALDDEAIERALEEPETAAQLTGYVQLMVRESLLAVVQAQIARALKDTQGAKQFFELAQMAKLLEGMPQAADPAAEMNELERSILEGLRKTLADSPEAAEAQ